ncbi:hypothetical protein CFC21_079286 [Triticum aestivum]|uniref:Uncharacterized protein n=2 Tax=Triticum aestivum TaxID=4565 RepID=A0A9R1HYP8_WHEAT|nr:hypothetical protein CFC21_079284 [Triticum aestivum]KAF7074414.1 hypothetical protein CFC21_079286 [Triticum aestivum]
MDTILASSKRLCQMVFDAGLQPGTEERLRMVLATAAAECIFNASFVPWFKEAVVGFLESFTVVTRTADELAARLTAMRPTCTLPAALAGLRGDNLFRALQALWLPTTASEGVHLEVALAAQRLALQETVDCVIRAYEQIIYERKSTASVYEDTSMAASLRRRLTLDGIVEKHINLAAAAAAPRPPTTPPVN